MNLPEHLLIFDGECLFCQNSMQWIIRHDKKKKFYFCSGSSETAVHIKKKLAITALQADSIIYVHRGEQFFIKSDCLFHLVKELGFPYTLAYIWKLFPKRLRDMMYDFIARNRYKWFGKSNQCYLPAPEQAGRFLG